MRIHSIPVHRTEYRYPEQGPWSGQPLPVTCTVVGVATGGGEVFVHPPTRTNPIHHTIRIRMGSLIQEKYQFDMINVPQKDAGERHMNQSGSLGQKNRHHCKGPRLWSSSEVRLERIFNFFGSRSAAKAPLRGDANYEPDGELIIYPSELNSMIFTENVHKKTSTLKGISPPAPAHPECDNFCKRNSIHDP